MKTVLITGASAGLGVDFAELFAKDGYSLILVARRREQLQAVANRLLKAHPKIRIDVIDFDLSIGGAGLALFQKVKSMNIHVDYLINNAGFGSNGEFRNLPLQKELQMIDLNIRTLVELTHAFLPAMISRKSGGVLNVASTAAFQPGPYMATYCATKAFVVSFSEALHEELKNTGVVSCALAPGATATEFAKVAGNDNSRLFKSGNVANSMDVAKVGYDALFAGKALAVSGLLNKILAFSVRLTPRFVVRKIAAFLAEPARGT
ncbi:MAG: SDR family oxidoreductase [Bdellovibrionales bacterium]|nr:SDR family oxidoreductase [Bdellovibrionales bacterium]